MISRCIESIETMPLALDVRTVRQSEAHSTKNRDRAIEHLREWVQRADFCRRARQRDVDTCERLGLLFRLQGHGALFECRRDRAAPLVQKFADDRLLVLAERLHLFAPQGDAAVPAKITNAH